MKKDEQLQFLAWAVGVTKDQVEKILEAQSEMIKDALSDATGKPLKESKIKIEGLGTFEVRETAAGTVQNPQVLGAKKAESEGKATDEQKALLAKLAAGETWETREKLASQKIGFKPEKALKKWVGAVEEDED